MEKMERIASFNVNHDTLQKGMYVSRIDGDVVTYDIRMKRPNMGDYVSNEALHTFEHLFATYARNSEFSDQVIYIGPMGCRTGFYLILKGKLESKDIVELMKELYKFMAEFKGDIPGATAIECGNYLDQNLPMANYEAKKYLEETLENLSEENLNYPE